MPVLGFTASFIRRIVQNLALIVSTAKSIRNPNQQVYRVKGPAQGTAE